MDIVVTGRNRSISDNFRHLIEDKVSKVSQLATRVQRVEVVVSRHESAKHPEDTETVEITVIAAGPALRAEASASDKYGALDLAWAKILERLRRARDKRKVSRTGRHRPLSTSEVFAHLGLVADPQEDAALEETVATSENSTDSERTAVSEDSAASEEQGTERAQGRIQAEGDSPVVLREKTFPATPLSIDEALSRMEMVGHDFYLYIDKDNNCPSVVYRRKGWSYGVISLTETEES